MNTLPINDFECNYIKETICKIDKIQKEVISDSVGRCITCETSLFTSANNTIPVSLYRCNGDQVTANIGTTTTTTTLFRIEAIRCNRFVTLRLLENVETGLTGTEYTTILDLDCIGQIQCFEPITVTECTTE